jgi:hypothetical protein
MLCLLVIIVVAFIIFSFYGKHFSISSNHRSLEPEALKYNSRYAQI